MIYGDEWTDAQRHFAQLIYDVVAERGSWPRFEYLDHEHFKRGFDAQETFRSFPAIGRVGIVGLPSYCDVRSPDRAAGLRPESPVALSVGGLWRLMGDDSPAGTFVDLLTIAGQRRHNAVVDPIDGTTVQLSDTEFAQKTAGTLSREVRWLMGQLISTEPPGITGLTLRTGPDNPDGSWLADVSSAARQFAHGTATPGEYLKLIEQTLTPLPTPQPRVLSSPISLLVAFDYLNMTWQRHCRRPLVQPPSSLEPTGRLAFEAGNADEFKSRLSVLGDILKNLQTHSAPGISGHALDRLRAYLQAQGLDHDDLATGEAALDRLADVANIRNGLQHDNAAVRGNESWSRLRLPYPPMDWSSIWQEVRSMSTEAILDLRATVEKLPAGGCTEHSP